MMSADTCQCGVSSQVSHRLEGTVNHSFVDDSVIECGVVMSSGELAAEADMDQCSDGGSESAGVKVMVVADDGASVSLRTDVADAVSDFTAASTSDTVDPSQLTRASTVHNVPTSTLNARDAVNHHRAVPCDLNTEQTDAANAVMNHTLPSYTASLSNCQPVMRHQTATSSSLWPHRKLCTECCLHCVVTATSLRFLLAVVLLTGAGCMAGGIALGAVNMSAGNDYFTLSAVFVGQFLTYLLTGVQC